MAGPISSCVRFLCICVVLKQVTLMKYRNDVRVESSLIMGDNHYYTTAKLSRLYHGQHGLSPFFSPSLQR